ncbi:glycosyl transferase family 1 [Neorhizobium alkalisoli]|uniref:Glycosyl transferase family 1 n=2 Tax=Neorhizobium alkalisoli TaxID=528178 RepID=A0A561R3I4_9HYPH|nr:glycosyl transferase family 1 [Neorhizobium alkalisoli]
MPPARIETTRVLFDISRLFRCRSNAFATGVDRIDLALAFNLVRQFADHCHFVHAGPAGPAIVDQAASLALLAHLDKRWNDPSSGDLAPFSGRRFTADAILRGLTRSEQRKLATADTTYVVASHSGLGKVEGALKRLDPEQRMRRFVYLHDIIPLEMPEYQRPETRGAFERYLRELTDSPLVIASNSDDTDMRVRKLAAKEKWPVETFTVLKPQLSQMPIKSGEPRPLVSAYLADPRPFFTIIGTIEPRKNHLLLLNLWRQLAEECDAPPRLCIIGKRGWENENVLDMLDRCDAIKGLVTEFGSLSDTEVQLLMMRAEALLFPSFVEGLGIPLLEAAAMNLPCIVSDIPVFREVAPAGTIFLDPLDGPGWKRSIMSKTGKQHVPSPAGSL